MSLDRNAGVILITLCTSVAGCSSSSGRPEGAGEADKIAVYEAVPKDPRAYRLVRRVWVEKWISVFTVPSYRSVDEGASDLRNQAAALGGDAVMNFGCYRRDPNIPVGSAPALVCNGNVIKYVQ